MRSSVALRRERSLPSPDRDYSVAFEGGLNLVDSDMAMPEGSLTGCLNYEIATDGGYERLAGYRAYDGRGDSQFPVTSYQIVPFASVWNTGLAGRIGNTINGLSGASGELIAFKDNGIYVNNLNLYSEDWVESGNIVSYLTDERCSGALVYSGSTFFNEPDFGRRIKLHVFGNSGGSGTSLFCIDHSTNKYAVVVGDHVLYRFYVRMDLGEAAPGWSKYGIRIKQRATGAVRFVNDGGGGAGLSVDVVADIGGDDHKFYTKAVNQWQLNRRVITNRPDGSAAIVEISMVTNRAMVAGNIGFELTAMVYRGSGWRDANEANGVPLGLFTIGGFNGGVSALEEPSFYNYPKIAQTYYVKTGSVITSFVNGYLVFPEVTAGPFWTGDLLSDAGLAFATGWGPEIRNGEKDPVLHAQYIEAARQALAVSDPEPCPGQGPVRGVWMYRGSVYSFRDDIGGATARCWKGTATGWEEVIPNKTLTFNSGNSANPILPGTLIYGQTSTDYAIVERVVVTSGSMSAGTGVGLLVLSPYFFGDITFANGENIRLTNGAGAIIAVTTGASGQPTIPAGGKYEFRNYNFWGHTSPFCMYGVNGVGRGFEICDNLSGNGPTFSFIRTGMDGVSAPAALVRGDKPTHLACHRGQLWYSFGGGSIQRSSVGDPFMWSVVVGAGEIAIGDECTGFLEEINEMLFVMARNRKMYIDGLAADTQSLRDFNPKSGSLEWSIQNIGGGMMMDDFGFLTLTSTDRYGNYADNTISAKVQPLVKDLLVNSTVKCSVVFRRNNTYRCFFDDRRMVSVTFNGRKLSGIMLSQLAHTANVCCSEEDSTAGSERIFFGADDGYVYEMESGNSFAGEAIEYGLRFPNWYKGAPGNIKKYSSLRLEGQIGGAVNLNIDPTYDAGTPDMNVGEPVVLHGSGGAYWDSFVWDQFIWDEQARRLPSVKLEGEGLTVSLHIYGRSTTEPKHNLRAAIVGWRPRRRDRRT